MNILQINTLDNVGGAAKVAYALQNELKKNNHKSSIFVGKKYSEDNDVFLIQKPNFIFKLIKKITKRDPSRYLREKIDKIFASDIDFYNIKNLLSSKQYKEADIIHCHNLHSGFFTLSALKKISKKKPIIWTLHDMWAITHKPPHAFDGSVKGGFYEYQTKNDSPFIIKYLRQQKKKIYNNTNMHIVVPSLWLKEKVENSVLKDKKISLIYNGIDTSTFKPYDKIEARKELNLPENKKIIIFIAHRGKDNPWKGWGYFKEVAKHYENNENILFLSIGGESKQQDEKNIKFINSIKDTQLLAKYYSAGDVLLFPSIAENFPLVIIEAMACGLPVVSFDVGGVKEAVIHKECGYIAEYKNTTDLISGIEYIFGLDKNYIKKNVRNKVLDKFTLEKMTDNYLTLYDKILNK